MVGIISGSSLGLFNSSLDVLGTEIGQSGIAQANTKAYANIATGNLSIQFLDEAISGTGADLQALRTYNSFGGVTDGDADGWRWDGEKRIVGIYGSATITRILGDGSQTIFNWDAASSSYISYAGSGTHDNITWSAANNVWYYYEDNTGALRESYSGSTGWIGSSRDSIGNELNYVFTNNKLTSITNKRIDDDTNIKRQRFDFIYDSSTGKLSELRTFLVSANGATNTLVKQVGYEYYPSSGLLSKVTTELTPEDTTDTATYVTEYVYDTLNRLTTVRQNAISASFTYDGNTYRIKTVTDQGGTTTYDYIAASGGNLAYTLVTNGLGETWRYTYDANNQLRKMESMAVDGVTQSKAFTYTAKGDVATMTDGRGNVTTYSYDEGGTKGDRGNRAKEVDSAGNTIFRVFTDKNRLESETRYTGTSTTATLPSGAETTRYIYNSAGNVRFTVSPEGRVSEVIYQSSGNGTGLVAQTRQYTGASRYTNTGKTEANLVSWVASLTADEKKLTQVTAFEYDFRGNLSKKTSYATADGTGAGVLDTAADITEYSYSAYGELLQVYAVRGSDRTTKVQLSSVTYDGIGRQTSVVNEAGTTTTLYSGPVAIQYNTSGVTTVTLKDSLGRVYRVEQHDGVVSRFTNYVYDAAGRLRMTEDPAGRRTYLFYDAAGRVNAKVEPYGTAIQGAVTSYTYDADGRVLSETQYYNEAYNTGPWFNVATSQVTKNSLNIGDDSEIRDVYIETADDRTTTYTYDAAGRLKTTTKPLQAVITNTYDGESRLVKTTQGDRITNYYYDKDGRQVGMLDAERYLTQYVYDGAGRLTLTVRYGSIPASVTQQTSADFDSIRTTVNNGPRLTTYYFYDTEGRQVGVVNEQGFLTETVYDAAYNFRKTIQYFQPVTVSESATFVILEKLSDVKLRAGSSVTTTTNFDAYGRVSNVVGPDSTVNSNVYDSAGRLVRQIQAEGTSDQRAARTRYNAFGDITGTVSGVGEATLASDATADQITTAINNYGVRYDIDSAGRKIAEYQPSGQKTLLYYDDAGRLTCTVNALGEVTRMGYNLFGQVNEILVLAERIDISGLTGGVFSSVLGSRVSPKASIANDKFLYTYYNQAGLLTSKEEVDGNYNVYIYNNYGELANSRAYTSLNTSTLTEYGRDKLGRQTYIKNDVDVGGLSILSSQTTYDGFGRLDKSIDGNNKTTVTSYTNNGRTVTVTDPLGRTGKIEVDPFGRTVKSYDGFDKVTFYDYNDVNRTLTVTTPEGSKITTTKTRTGETYEVKDANGNIIRYAYTKDGKLDITTNITTNVVLADNDYDASGRLYESKDANGVVTRYGYDAANRVTTKTVDPTGLNIRTTYEFDGQGRQILVTEGAGAAAASVTQYKYNRAGKITKIIVDPKSILTTNDNPNGLDLVTTFTYDRLGHILSVEKGAVTAPSQQKTVYTFDKLGRKTSEIVDPSVAAIGATPAYTGLNIKTEYRYDKNGNLTRVIDANQNSTWFIYDNAGQKTHQIDATGAVTAFEYDKNGRVYHTRQYATLLSESVVGAFENVVTSITPTVDDTNDHRSYTVYDKNGRSRYSLTAANANGWIVSEAIYDANNNVTETRTYDKPISNANVASIAANGAALDPVITTDEVAAQLTALGYSAGNLGESRVTRYAYDANNRVTSTINAEGVITKSIYDAKGNLIQTTVQPSATNILTGTQGITGSWNSAVEDAAELQFTSARSARLTKSGELWVKEGATDVLVQTNVNAFQIKNDRIAVLQNGVLSVKEGGLSSAWVQQSSGVVTFQLEGSRIAILLNDGTFKVKEASSANNGLNAAWDLSYSNVTKFQLAGDRIGILSGDKYVYVKVGALSSNWIDMYTMGYSYGPGKYVKDIQLLESSANNTASSNRIAILFGDGKVWLNKVGDGSSGPSVQFSGVSKMQLTGPYIGILKQNSDLELVNIDLMMSSLNKESSSVVCSSVQDFKIEGNRLAVLNNYDELLLAQANSAGNLASPINPIFFNVVAQNVQSFALGVSSVGYVSGINAQTHYIYDKAGHLRFTVDALGNVTENIYDSLGHIIRTTQFAAIARLNGNYSEANISNLVNRNNSDNRTTNYVYDQAGRLCFTVNALGYVAKNTYDALGHIKCISQFDVALLDLTGSSYGITPALDGTYSYLNLQKITGSYAFGGSLYRRETYFDFDKAGRQTKTTLPGWYWTYNGKWSGQASPYSGPPGSFQRTIEVTYDGLGNAVSSKIRTSYSDYIYQYKTYDMVGREVNDIDALGYVTQKSYDALGNLKTETRFGNANSIVGVPSGNYWSTSEIATKLMGKAGRKITYEYDKLGRKKSITQPSANNYASPNEQVTTNNSLSTYFAAGVTSFQYDVFNNVIKQTVAIDTGRIAETYFYYDKLGQQILTVDPEGYGTRKTYNAFGNLLKATEYSASTTTTNITTATQPTFVDNAGVALNLGYDRVTSFAYDALGHVKVTGRRINGLLRKVKTTEYNSFGEVEKSWDAQNNVTQFSYNSLGKVKTITDVERMAAGTALNVFDTSSQRNISPVTTITYNAFGERTKETRSTSSGLGTVHIFDVAGNETQTIDELGNSTFMEYDIAGRIISQSQAASVTDAPGDMNYSTNITRRFEYDKVGRQTATLDVFGSQKSGQVNIYNGYGEVIEERKVWGNAATDTATLSSTEASFVRVNTYDYDDAGRVFYKHSANGHFYFYYDLMGNVTRMEQRESAASGSKDRITENYYNKLGYLKVQRLPAYSVTSGWKSEVTSLFTPLIVQNFDRWGNVISRTDPAKELNGDGTVKTTIYTFNQDNQLLTETTPLASTIKYSSDVYNSKVRRQLNYDTSGNLTSEVQFAYDDSGALISSRTSVTNVYNAANQLIKTSDATNVFKEFIYDGQGNRVGTKDAVGHVWLDTFDANNQLTAHAIIRKADGTEFKGVGDALIAAPLASYKYDQAGRKYREGDALGAFIYYKFDDRSNITFTRNRMGGLRGFAFDELGNKIQERESGFIYTNTYPNGYDNSPTLTTVAFDKVLNTWNYKNASLDFVDFASSLAQFHIGTNGDTYIHSYTKFGELEKESLSGSAANVRYNYFENGLLKQIIDTTGASSSVGTSSTVDYFYDKRGNRVVEKNSSLSTVSGTTSVATTYSSYDVRNRLVEVASPTGEVRVNDASYATANLASLLYSYDEWGNRRRISATYTVQGGTQASKAEWFGYDAADRVLVEGGTVVNNHAGIVAGNNSGTIFIYDAAGRRQSEETAYANIKQPTPQYDDKGNLIGWNGSSSYISDSYARTLFYYNDLGLTSKIQVSTKFKAPYSNSDSAGTFEDEYVDKEIYKYDDRGFKKETQLLFFNKTITNEYNADGQLTHNVSAGVEQTNYSYDTSGNLTSYQYISTSGQTVSKNIYSYQYVDTYSGRQVDTITVNSNQAGLTSGATTNSYNKRGQLIRSAITEIYQTGLNGSPSSGITYRNFAYNVDGRIIARADKKANTSNYKVQNYFYTSSGGELANIGQIGVEISPLTAVSRGGDIPGNYTVSAGDTLMSIAQVVFGDSKLWYLIADANSLIQRPTDEFSVADVGRNLRIPNNDKNISNTSNNFKPYNANEVIGDLTPSPSIIPPPKKHQCTTMVRMVSTIIAIVVAAVVYTYTGKEDLAAAAYAGTKNYAQQYGQKMADGEWDFGRWLKGAFREDQYKISRKDWGFLDPLDRGLKSGDHIDQEQVLISATAAYIGSYVGGNNAFVKGYVENAASYGLNRLHGNKPTFSNRAAMSAGFTNMANQYFFGNDGSSGQGGFGSEGFSWTGFVTDVGKNYGRSVVSYGSNKAFGVKDTHWDGKAAFADSFAGAFGSAAASWVSDNIHIPQKGTFNISWDLKQDASNDLFGNDLFGGIPSTTSYLDKTLALTTSTGDALLDSNAAIAVVQQVEAESASPIPQYEIPEEIVVTGYREADDKAGPWVYKTPATWQDHAVYDAYTGNYIPTTLSNRDANMQWTKQLRDLHNERSNIMQSKGLYGPAQGFALGLTEYRRNTVYDDIAKYNDQVGINSLVDIGTEFLIADLAFRGTLGTVGALDSFIGRSAATNSVNKAFKPGEDLIHFEKHGSEIAETLGFENYSVTQYVQDANSVIRNGTFSPELNAYVSVPGGSGSAKGLMVGLDRSTGEITTMHMKPVSWFEMKAPSLGWEAQPKGVKIDTVGPNPQNGWKWPYSY